MARIIETEVGKNSIQKKSVKRQNLLSEWLTDVKGKRRRTDEEVEGKVEDIEHVEDPCWTKVSKADLSVTYSVIFDRNSANKIFASLESEIEYFTGDLAQIKVFGKLHPIPRQQSAYGDPGVKYRYSGLTVPALAWTPCLLQLREAVSRVAGARYNFVLVNRYRDGGDKMGDHKDDEKELDPSVPIASLTFGAERDFVFKHQDRRTNKVEDVKITLLHGMLLLMHHPTNKYWYHGLPQRKKCFEPRINLTFRKIIS